MHDLVYKLGWVEIIIEKLTALRSSRKVSNVEGVIPSNVLGVVRVATSRGDIAGTTSRGAWQGLE